MTRRQFNIHRMKQFLILLLLATAGPDFAAGLDRNTNSLNDVWELQYGTLAPGDDPDGDGFTNAQESAAGTNPFDPLSHPPRLSIAPWPASLTRFEWASVAGKRYHLISRTNVAAGAWLTNVSFVADGAAGAAFFPRPMRSRIFSASPLTTRTATRTG